MAWTERYVRADAAGSGDGTTDTNSGGTGAFTLGEAITHSASNTGVRYNVRAGTYANGTSSLTFNGVGTTTAPNWWRGFSTTPGDLDADYTTAKPYITFTTGRFIITGAYQIFSNLRVEGAPTAANSGVISLDTRNCIMHRVRAEATNANSNGRAFVVQASSSNTHNTISSCYMKSTSSADVVLYTGGTTEFLGCVFDGGANGLTSGSAARDLTLQGCVFINNGGNGFQNSLTGRVTIGDCCFYDPAGNGIEYAAMPSSGTVIGCIFSECGAYGVNNSSGGNGAVIFRAHNLFHSNTSGTETGLGDSPSFNDQTDSSSPFTNAAGGDFSLSVSTNAKGKNFPGAFENQSYASYGDIGAVQREEVTGGGDPFPSTGLQSIESGVCA